MSQSPVEWPRPLWLLDVRTVLFLSTRIHTHGAQGSSQLCRVPPPLNPSLRRVQKPVFSILFNGINFVLHNAIIFCEKPRLKIDFSHTLDPSSLTLYHFRNSLVSISQELPPAVIFFIAARKIKLCRKL